MSIHFPAISSFAFEDEAAAVRRLLSRVEHMDALDADIMAQASTWVRQIRSEGMGHGMEAFLHTYGLDTREGVALMCLAEALLRIPDSDTADSLIQESFTGKNWRMQIEGDESWLINATSWGLWLSGKVVNFGQSPASGVVATVRELSEKLSEPVIRQALKQAMRVIGAQFVLGETIDDGLERAKPLAKKGYRFSYDILGEGARSEAQATTYMDAYRNAITAIGAAQKMQASSGSAGTRASIFAAPSISVKLSALHPRFSLTQHERVFAELLPRLKELMLLAKKHHISVSIDAEEANRLDITLMLFAEIFSDAAFADYNGIGFVLQAYQKRAVHVLDALCALAKQYGRIIPIRLVKGAYWDAEVKHAQVHGLPDYPVFVHKEITDVSYLACADYILQNSAYFYPQFATHNARTAASIQQLARHYQLPAEALEFQRLQGMGEKLHTKILAHYPSRIYAPIGQHKDLLAYLIRRLLENGANSSFVNLLMDDDVPISELLADPIAKVRSQQQQTITRIPLPQAIYSDRKNSAGQDFGYLSMAHAAEHALKQHVDIFAQIGEVEYITTMMLDERVSIAEEAFEQWSTQSVEVRCRIIEAAADAFEAHADMAIALLVKEAKKTIVDAVLEVREAADFCRYYARHARRLMATPEVLESPTGEANDLSLHPRGVFACISPWNFPLAIFVGQAVAALVTGNCVLAKPAEQTPRIAKFAIQIMHEAGIPKEVLQLAIGQGSIIGEALTLDKRIAGVVFTGSVGVAHIINHTLAKRGGAIVPFIAETGGQNCMVVDSTVLLEHAVDDIIISAFGSAGQRCSALRVLYVQEEIADALLTLLTGAMQELRIGDPADLATDIGPVIDEEAQAALEAHIAHLEQTARRVAIAPASKTSGTFVLPQAFEIPSLDVLEDEHFGPILHVIRYKATERQAVVDAINASDFGLTFGIHSRIEANIQYYLKRIRAGNRYVNRSMTGAVVGVQPFGGEGLSGTGPKAGGPYYLLKFLHERTTTINTAAIGGNLALLMG